MQCGGYDIPRTVGERNEGARFVPNLARVGMTRKVRPVASRDSIQAAAEFLFAQGETSSVVAAQLIISQVCNGHRRTGFGYYWEFPHRGRPMTLETRKLGR